MLCVVYTAELLCCQVLDVDLAEGRVRANFQLPSDPSLNGIIRHHAVDCFAVCVAAGVA